MPVRPMLPADIPEVLRIQADAYPPAILESADTFQRKLTLFPRGCLIYEESNRAHGYIFSHPWQGLRPVPLDFDALILPVKSDGYYIHDLAVETACRGKGIGKLLIDQVLRLRELIDLPRCLLVAVQGTEAFWAQFGFAPAGTLIYANAGPATLMIREERSTVLGCA